jgi:hypothetical protein
LKFTVSENDLIFRLNEEGAIFNKNGGAGNQSVGRSTVAGTFI